MVPSSALLPTQSDQAIDTPVHPLGSRANVLLCSVFGPYAQDDEYGSRVINPMELYHNQVTREQGPFSLRIFHRSWGLMLIQSNLEARCTLLDFPDLDRFVEEIRENQYDVVGISSILVNVLKVKKMCELIREHLPQASIVVGGHVANLPDLANRVDADHLVKGEGVQWFRHFLGEDEDRPIRHPKITTPINLRALGMNLDDKPCNTAATLIPSVGCPMGCNFCSTSAMFGGKGKFHNFYDSGDELFDVLCQLEETMQARSFFVMDENFLLHRKRSLRLLALMEQHDKAWSFYVFSSANVLGTYSIEQLVGLGVSWVWMGLEGEESQYAKLKGIDTKKLVRELQSHGIRILGSTIIGLEEHTPENIHSAIDYAVSHDTDFHQFMLYTPLPGTPLHAQLSEQGAIKNEQEYDLADAHGQFEFNYRHPHFTEGEENDLLRLAFQRDFDVNGPSLARVVRTTLAGWKRYKNHPDARVRRRIAWESSELASNFSAMIAAMKRYYRKVPNLHARMSNVLRDLKAEYGLKSRFFASLAGPYVLYRIRAEEKRLTRGWTCEPPTFYEKNFGFDKLATVDASGALPCQYVEPRLKPTSPVARNVPAAIGACEQ